MIKPPDDDGAASGSALPPLEPFASAEPAPPRKDKKRPPSDKTYASAPRKFVYLPSWRLAIDKAAPDIFESFARKQLMFIQGDDVVEVSPSTTGSFKLVPVTPSAFRSRLEQLGELVAFRADKKGGWSWKPTLCSEDTAKALLASKSAKDLLPRITNVFSCPVAVVTLEGSFKVLCKGYHPDGNGIFISSGTVVL